MKSSRNSFNCLVIVVCIYIYILHVFHLHAIIISLAYCRCSRVHTIYILKLKSRLECSFTYPTPIPPLLAQRGSHNQKAIVLPDLGNAAVMFILTQLTKNTSICIAIEYMVFPCLSATSHRAY